MPDPIVPEAAVDAAWAREEQDGGLAGCLARYDVERILTAAAPYFADHVTIQAPPGHSTTHSMDATTATATWSCTCGEGDTKQVVAGRGKAGAAWARAAADTHTINVAAATRHAAADGYRRWLARQLRRATWPRATEPTFASAVSGRVHDTIVGVLREHGYTSTRPLDWDLQRAILGILADIIDPEDPDAHQS